jgi:hypothetical protein
MSTHALLPAPCVRVVVHRWTFLSIFRWAGWDDDVAYSAERKAAILKKILPPNTVPLRQLSRDEGISEATLYGWRKEARSKGQLLPDADAAPESWSSCDKLVDSIAKCNGSSKPDLDVPAQL